MTPTRKYAGIGSRVTPEPILASMQALAYSLAKDEWVLRTGYAEGADKAFLEGARKAGGLTEVYLPWPGYNTFTARRYRGAYVMFRPTPAAYEMASRYHPNWLNLSPGARHLHARNCHIILGPELNDPVAHVLYWHPPGAEGGTGMGLRLAKVYGITTIPVQGEPLPHERNGSLIQRFIPPSAG